MATRNHRNVMNQSERSFWRDVYVALISRGRNPNVKRAADVADASVAQLRQRITWRAQP